MNARKPQRVTRTYARGLVAAVAILAIALLIAGWGGLSLVLGRSPVVSNVSRLAAPLMIIGAVGLLIMVLWRQVIDILRGNRAGWMYTVIVPGAAYLLWCVAGVLAGMTVEETWLSPFAWLLALCWLVALLIFWAVFLRRVYSDKEPPKWPWEKNVEDDDD